MKTIHKLFLGLSLLALTSCAPVLETLSTELVSSTAVNSSNLGETNSALTYISITANLVNAADQRLVLNFDKVVDASTLQTGINFYKLANAVDSFTAYDRTHVVKSSIVVGTSIVYTLDLTGYTINQIEMDLVGNDLTANNGAAKLDTNGNTIYGEAYDTRIVSIPVGLNQSGIPALNALTTGQLINPSQVLTVTTTDLFASNQNINVTNYNVGVGTTFTFFVQDTGSSATPSSITLEADAVMVFKNVNGAWVSETSTTAYAPATQIATISLPTAPTTGNSYKIVLNRYLVHETTAVRGFIHRASYDQFNLLGNRDVVRYYTFARGVTTNATNPTLTKGGSRGAFYVDVTTTEPIDMATVTSSSLKLYLDGAALASGEYISKPGFYPYTVQILESSASNAPSNTLVRSFRVFLPSYISALPSVTTSYSLYFAPSILTVTNSIDNTVDRLSFGDITAGNNGFRIRTF